VTTTELSTFRLISDLLKDPERKPVFRIACELFSLCLMHRRFPRFYFSRYLFKRNRTNIGDYYPDKFFDKIKPLFNDKEARDVLENKLYFDFYYNQFNVSRPRIFMYNHRKVFVADGKILEVNSPADFRNLLKNIINTKSADKTVFIKKTFWSYGGHQIYKIHLDQIDNNLEMIDNLYQTIITTGFLFQETVKQHPEMDQLNSSCLNTLRIDSFIDRNGDVELLSGYLRTSIRNMHIDNISSGGCAIPVDLQTGRLKKEGYLTLKMSGVKLLTQHPVTKTVFENFSIPFFNDAKELVIRAAGLVPCLRLVGWDVAIGESGPVLLEGNSDYNMTGNDLTSGGFRLNPVFRKLLQELNTIRSTRFKDTKTILLNN
jgi:hypothetical protein